MRAKFNPMPETVKIDLSSEVEPFGALTVEWWEEDSKCVVVRGSIKKDSETFALRLDLDKRAFLDRLENKKTEKLLQSQVGRISQLVWGERLRRRNEAIRNETIDHGNRWLSSRTKENLDGFR